jgi:hypothetical protein
MLAIGRPKGPVGDNRDASFRVAPEHIRCWHSIYEDLALTAAVIPTMDVLA